MNDQEAPCGSVQSDFGCRSKQRIHASSYQLASNSLAAALLLPNRCFIPLSKVVTHSLHFFFFLVSAFFVTRTVVMSAAGSCWASERCLVLFAQLPPFLYIFAFLLGLNENRLSHGKQLPAHDFLMDYWCFLLNIRHFTFPISLPLTEAWCGVIKILSCFRVAQKPWRRGSCFFTPSGPPLAGIHLLLGVEW